MTLERRSRHRVLSQQARIVQGLTQVAVRTDPVDVERNLHCLAQVDSGRDAQMRLDHLRILGRRLRKIPTARIEQTSLNQQLLNKRALLLFGPLGFLAPVGFRLGRDDASGSPLHRPDGCARAEVECQRQDQGQNAG